VQELHDQLKNAGPPPGDLGVDPLDPNDIDVNACAWKIVYVVTSWTTVGPPVRSYTYAG
jgi:hypothetical protein